MTRTFLLRLRPWAVAAGCLIGSLNCLAHAQLEPAPSNRNLGPGEVKVSSEFESIEVVIGSSRLITMPFSIPRVVIEDPSILSATPLAKDQILIRALATGVTSVGIIDENDRSYTIEVNVVSDVRQLQAIINHTFPTANITVRPLKESIVLVGTVPNPEMAAQVVDVAKQFSERVFQNLQVSGAQNISLTMKIYEVSRTKLRRIGSDWQFANNRFAVIQGAGDLIDMAANQALVNNPASPVTPAMRTTDGQILATGDTFRTNILRGSSQLTTAIEFLEQHDVARLIDEPTLVTLNGRPAEFLSGGEVPILVNAGLGVASIEFRPFGTKVDFLPIVLGEGRLKIDLRYEVSQLAPGLSGDTDTPGFTVSRTNVGAEITAGHTLAIAGVVKEQSKTVKRGLPGLMHAPWIGAAFSKNNDQVTEVEMLVIATPQFIGEVDPSMLPGFGPAENSESPLNMEFYGRGYVEVPRCDPPVNQAGYGGQGYPGVTPAQYQGAPAEYQGAPVAPMAPPAKPPATSPTVGRGIIEPTMAPRAPQANNLPFGAGPRR
jgi:pilus assembly protein CpaC